MTITNKVREKAEELNELTKVLPLFNYWDDDNTPQEIKDAQRILLEEILSRKLELAKLMVEGSLDELLK